MAKATVATLSQDLRSAFERIERLEAELATLKAGRTGKAKRPAPTLEDLERKGKALAKGSKAWAAVKAQYLALRNKAAYQVVAVGDGFDAMQASAAAAKARAEREAAKAAAAQS